MLGHCAIGEWAISEIEHTVVAEGAEDDCRAPLRIRATQTRPATRWLGTCRPCCDED
jgi:hypothetical protein